MTGIKRQGGLALVNSMAIGRLAARQELMACAEKNSVERILSWYGADNPGCLEKLHRLFMQGQLAGTGKLVILPVDQGFEHGPMRSFAPNPAAYDPLYHFQLAVDAGCSAYAAPLGFLEAGAREFAGRVPLILKLNNADSLLKTPPGNAITASLDDALRLGCVGIGFTIYPGSQASRSMYENLAHLARAAKRAGLLVVVWAYPRGEGIQATVKKELERVGDDDDSPSDKKKFEAQATKEHEQALDVVAYAAHIAAQLGAHIIKVKPPMPKIVDPSVKKFLDENEPWAENTDSKKSNIQTEDDLSIKSMSKEDALAYMASLKEDALADYMASLSTRVRYVRQSCFDGRRVVIFSGGPAQNKKDFLNEVRELARGGSFGSIVGRNAFTRPKKEAIDLLRKVMEIYRDSCQ